MDVIRSFRALMLAEIPNCPVLTAIYFEGFQNSSLFKLTEQRADFHIVGGEKAHLERNGLPFEYALVVSLDTQAEAEKTGLEAG